MVNECEMTIGQLRKMLRSKPPEISWEEWDKMPVMIPTFDEIDGEWFISPCQNESGMVDMDLIDEEKEATETVFLITPQGYYSEDINEEPPAYLN